MDDALKTKDNLINELAELRQRIEFYEESVVRHQQTHVELLDSKEIYRSILEASPN